MVNLTGYEKAPDDDDLSGYAHRQLIGWIGLLLPLLLGFLVWNRDGEQAWICLGSVSAYYYTGAVVVFVGMLVALALFLLTYRGFDNTCKWLDRVVAWIAGLGCLVVAFFPAKVSCGFTRLTWWKDWMDNVHLFAAGVVFAMFAVFSLWLFRVDKKGKPHLDGWRDWVYLLCGAAIVVFMAWAIWNGQHDKHIFWQESGALVAFSFAWLVKGRPERTVRAVHSFLRRKLTS